MWARLRVNDEEGGGNPYRKSQRQLDEESAGKRAPKGSTPDDKLRQEHTANDYFAAEEGQRKDRPRSSAARGSTNESANGSVDGSADGSADAAPVAAPMAAPMSAPTITPMSSEKGQS